MNTKTKIYTRGNKSVTLIGMCHIGTKNYYNGINYILSNFKPEEILYEKVKDKDNLMPKNTRLVHKAGLKFLTGLFNSSLQSDEIKYSEDSINSDLDYSTLKITHGDKPILDICEEEDINYFNNISDKAKKRLKIFAIIVLNLVRIFKKKEPVILNLRNYKVILDIFENFKTKNNLCITYGQAHMPQIEKYLKSVGFKCKSTDKHYPFK